MSVLEHFLSACEAWNLDEVHRVVESGFNVDAFDDDHVTGLQMAAATGNIGIVSSCSQLSIISCEPLRSPVKVMHSIAQSNAQFTSVIRILLYRATVVTIPS